MKNNKIIKSISILFIIVPLCMFIIFNVIIKDSFDVYNSTNYIAFTIIELLNIFFSIIIFRSKEQINKLLIIIFIIYIIITFFIPVYHLGHTYAPTGPGSELMGLALKQNYRDIYGMDITELVQLFK